MNKNKIVICEREKGEKKERQGLNKGGYWVYIVCVLYLVKIRIDKFR